MSAQSRDRRVRPAVRLVRPPVRTGPSQVPVVLPPNQTRPRRKAIGIGDHRTPPQSIWPTLGLLAATAFLAFGFPAIVVLQNAVVPAWFGEDARARAARAGVPGEDDESPLRHAQSGPLRSEPAAVASPAANEEPARDPQSQPVEQSGAGARGSAEPVRDEPAPATTRKADRETLPSELPSRVRSDRSDRNANGVAGMQPSRPDAPDAARERASDKRMPAGNPAGNDVTRVLRDARVAMSAQTPPGTRPEVPTPNPETSRERGAQLPAASAITAQPPPRQWRALEAEPRPATPRAVPGGVMLQSAWLKLCKEQRARRGASAAATCHVTTFLVDDPAPSLFAVSFELRPAASDVRLLLELVEAARNVRVWAGEIAIPVATRKQACGRSSCMLSLALSGKDLETLAGAASMRIAYSIPGRGEQSVVLSTDGLVPGIEDGPAHAIDARERISELTAVWARAAAGIRRRPGAGPGNPIGVPSLFTGRVFSS